MAEKFCPLREHAAQVASAVEERDPLKYPTACLGESCAWYDNGRDYCAILTIADGLVALAVDPRGGVKGGISR